MKIGLSATCYSDGFGARLRHLFLDTCKLVCLIKSATPALVIGVNGVNNRWLSKVEYSWLPMEFQRLGFWKPMYYFIEIAHFEWRT